MRLIPVVSVCWQSDSTPAAGIRPANLGSLQSPCPQVGLRVIYAQTDSLFVELKGLAVGEAGLAGHLLASLAVSKLAEGLRMNFERVLCPFLLLHVNRYAGRAFAPDDFAGSAKDGAGGVADTEGELEQFLPQNFARAARIDRRPGFGGLAVMVCLHSGSSGPEAHHAFAAPSLTPCRGLGVLRPGLNQQCSCYGPSPLLGPRALFSRMLSTVRLWLVPCHASKAADLGLTTACPCSPGKASDQGCQERMEADAARGSTGAEGPPRGAADAQAR